MARQGVGYSSGDALERSRHAAASPWSLTNYRARRCHRGIDELTALGIDGWALSDPRCRTRRIVSF
jgi:hypothetical protein